MRHAYLVALLVLALLLPAVAWGADDQAADTKPTEDESKLNAGILSGLTYRGIGPALTSGRIIDIAVDPEHKHTWYIAVASGGVWKTTNAGTTVKPIFDSQSSYSIGCVTVDPSNRSVIWVGSGENNSQRSVAYGDGVYRSRDGGASWENVGLGESEHIGKILVDPRDSNVVWVAAQGPLWKSGGDRGLYKTIDGGENWEQVLFISDDTGISDIAFDPRDPDTVYAAAYQRRRHVWTLINGGPEAGIHKTTDGGANWREINKGLPGGDRGRIGIAVAPTRPDTVYAMVEAEGDKGGFFRSTDRGESWHKQNGYFSGSPQYYQEIFVDPHNADRIYSMDTFWQVSEDGGKSWRSAGELHKHVDSHALWIDPDDPDHILNGNDGGVYETWDRGKTWKYMTNLPVTQFYRLGLDDREPFYHVYGGTQDNATLGGPSQTFNQNGIMSQDWYVTVFGDGFQTRTEPGNPDIVYSQWQYGGLIRYDHKTGDVLDIKPGDLPGEALRWNWDAPLFVSPHDKERIYFAANVVFRSDDRGNTWQRVSEDLTRQIDRNQLEVMGKVWPVDAVAKNRSTSQYGNLVTMSESPFVEGLIYAGSDDGLVQITEDGGENWRAVKSEDISLGGDAGNLPERVYVNRVVASRHDADTVYVAFNHHKMGDFTPYLVKSTDRGVTWTSIASDLPERGSVYDISEDHLDPDLLFVGTEFSAYTSLDGGDSWMKLAAGVPTISVRDLEIQEREDDLVLGTFGRGFYILDDYSALRHLDEAALNDNEAIIFPMKPVRFYLERYPYGIRNKAFFGEDFYTAPNPPLGATFTFYLRDTLETQKDQREKAEKEAWEAEETPPYPTWDQLREEDAQEKPSVFLTIRDSDGNIVRRLSGPTREGIHRVTWDMRYPSPSPVSLSTPDLSIPWVSAPIGPLAAPGDYTVEIAKRVDGEITQLAGPEPFTATPLGNPTLGEIDREANLAFQKKTARLQRAVVGANSALGELEGRIPYLKAAIDQTPEADPALGTRLRDVQATMREISTSLRGDFTKGRRQAPTSPSILNRIGTVVFGHWTTISYATSTHQDHYRIAAEEFGPVLDSLKAAASEIEAIEAALEAAGASWTPGRIPDWQPE
ncbi:MAG: glycosyl hydrolase [Acidobacteriota bacterium]